MTLHYVFTLRGCACGKSQTSYLAALAAGVCLLTVSSVARADSLESSVAVTRKSSRPGIIDKWMCRTNDAWTERLSTLSLPGIPQITDDLMNQPAVTVTNFVRATPRFLPLARCNLVSSMNWRA